MNHLSCLQSNFKCFPWSVTCKTLSMLSGRQSFSIYISAPCSHLILLLTFYLRFVPTFNNTMCTFKVYKALLYTACIIVYSWKALSIILCNICTKATLKNTFQKGQGSMVDYYTVLVLSFQLCSECAASQWTWWSEVWSIASCSDRASTRQTVRPLRNVTQLCEIFTQSTAGISPSLWNFMSQAGWESLIHEIMLKQFNEFESNVYSPLPLPAAMSTVFIDEELTWLLSVQLLPAVLESIHGFAYHRHLWQPSFLSVTQGMYQH